MSFRSRFQKMKIVGRPYCNRDPDADGTFYYSVKTTGVYCRPTCGARPPRRENVAFHLTREMPSGTAFVLASDAGQTGRRLSSNMRQRWRRHAG